MENFEPKNTESFVVCAPQVMLNYDKLQDLQGNTPTSNQNKKIETSPFTKSSLVESEKMEFIPSKSGISLLSE